MVIAYAPGKGRPSTGSHPPPQGDTSLKFLILLIAKLCGPEYRQTMATDLTDPVSSTDLTDPVNKISLDSYTKSCPPSWGPAVARRYTVRRHLHYYSYGATIRTWR